MTFWQNLLSGFRGGTTHFTPRVSHLGVSELAAMMDPSSMTAAKMWETQPHFRTVVSFVARNIAQLGLHVFERDGEDRRRDRDSVLAQTIQDVDGHTTTYELIFALVGDLALYDRAFWWVAPSSETTSGWMIRRLPPTWVEPVMANPWEVGHYLAYIKANGSPTRIPADRVLAFPGFHPGKMWGSSPTVDALRDTLKEQVEAAIYRGQIWKRGGRVSAVLERPDGAPPWSDEARERFREDWYAKYTGRGSHAGGTPILEDGMTLRRIDFNAQEQQYVEAAKLSLRTVAAAYHVNPTMIGDNDGANYSNVREFRKMLYGDTLGPMVAQIEARVNGFLVPRLGLDRRRFYVEFNIEEKLQGNFEEQAQALSASVGLPYMTRNEARAIRNLPAIEGGDELGVPLNYLLGGQTPARAGDQNRTGQSSRAVAVKAQAPESHVEQTRRVFERFFARQGRVVRSRLGQKDVDWWDQDRWDRELTDDLYRLAVTVAGEVASKTLDEIGFSPDRYDTDRTLAFLRAVSERVAGQVNTTTFQAIEAAIEDAEDVSEAVAHVFAVAEDSRAEQSSITLTTTLAGFATAEAAKQVAGNRARKQWVVNSANPRASHAAMNGETVGIEENFSNGMPWPGSIEGDVDEVAGCQCSLLVLTD